MDRRAGGADSAGVAYRTHLYTKSVYRDLPADLAEIVANWKTLPDALKADILAKVREAIGN